MNPLAEAGPLMRRAVAIGEQAYGGDHPNLTAFRDHLAQLRAAEGMDNTRRFGSLEGLHRPQIGSNGASADSLISALEKRKRKSKARKKGRRKR